VREYVLTDGFSLAGRIEIAPRTCQPITKQELLRETIGCTFIPQPLSANVAGIGIISGACQRPISIIGGWRLPANPQVG
jgi:hypothetical protein